MGLSLEGFRNDFKLDDNRITRDTGCDHNFVNNHSNNGPTVKVPSPPSTRKLIPSKTSVDKSAIAYQ